MANTPFEMPGSPNAPFLAGGNIATSINRFVKPDATEQRVVAMAAVTDQPIGLLRDAPTAAGQVAEVVQQGVYQVEAGAAIAYGALVQGGADGRAITAAATGYVCGRALQAAENAGELIAVFINCINPWLKA